MAEVPTTLLINTVQADPVREYCREDIEVDGLPERCNAPADFILWGKLFPSQALGPRCYDHAVKHLSHGAMSRVDQHAVLDLRGLYRAR